jgi:hypothetical protein
MFYDKEMELILFPHPLTSHGLGRNMYIRIQTYMAWTSPVSCLLSNPSVPSQHERLSAWFYLSNAFWLSAFSWWDLPPPGSMHPFGLKIKRAFYLQLSVMSGRIMSFFMSHFLLKIVLPFHFHCKIFVKIQNYLCILDCPVDIMRMYVCCMCRFYSN